MDRKGNKIHSIQKKKFGSVEFLFSTLIKFVSILVCTIYIRTLVPSLKKKKTQKVYISAVSPPSLSISPSLYAAVSSFFAKVAAVRAAVGFRKLPTIWVFFHPKKSWKRNMIWWSTSFTLHFFAQLHTLVESWLKKIRLMSHYLLKCFHFSQSTYFMQLQFQDKRFGKIQFFFTQTQNSHEFVITYTIYWITHCIILSGKEKS